VNVTVAVPCYNGAKYIEQTLQSILEQSRPSDEIIVVDDGSTDNSAEIIRHHPVRLIQHEENRGLAQARNTAIASANGDILAFVDVDAYADPHLLASLVKGYCGPKVGGVGGQGVEVNINSLADRWRRAHASQSYGQHPKTVDFLYGLCMSFRLDVLQEVGGFNPIFCTNAEDIDIGIRVNTAGYLLHYEPKAKVYHQRTDDEKSLKQTMVNWFTESYRAKRLNQAQPWKMFAGTLRRIVTDPLKDIFVIHDPTLLPLSISIGFLKLNALVQAAINSGLEEKFDNW
jgi:glycosyltransferase involved in cell wall biosynthesis